MRISLIILALTFISRDINAQITSPARPAFIFHTYYRLMRQDLLEISLVKSEDRKLLPSIDSIVKPYMEDYQRIADTSQNDHMRRRIEYNVAARSADVYFVTGMTDKYYFVNDQYFKEQQGRDTISITGDLPNGRPYRVRFIITLITDMRIYAMGNLDALTAENYGELGEGKKK